MIRCPRSLKLLSCLLIFYLFLSGVILSEANAYVQANNFVEAYYERDPILISGDQEFTKENGVVGGSGTAEDPYVIEGWYINYTQRGISVENTYVYFVIRNVRLLGPGMTGGGAGIMFSYVRNGKIENATVTNTTYGISLVFSSYNNITGNRVSNCWNGIRVDAQSSYTLIDNNDVYSQGQSGIALHACTHNTIVNNNVSGNAGIGINIFEHASYQIVANNSILNNGGAGIGVDYDSHFIKIIGNTLVRNGYGIKIGGMGTSPHDIDIYRNNFIDNGLLISSNSFSIRWDFEGEGNYWSDYMGVDIDGDGIGETVYMISAANRDNCPLVTPYSPLTMPEKHKSNAVWWSWLTMGLGIAVIVTALFTIKTGMYRMLLKYTPPAVIEIMLIASVAIFFYAFSTRLVLHDSAAAFGRFPILIAIIWLLRRKWNRKLVLAAGTISMLYGLATLISMVLDAEVLRSQWVLMDEIGLGLSLLSMLVVADYYSRPSAQEIKLEEMLRAKGRIEVKKVPEITGVGIKDVKDLFFTLSSRDSSLRGFYVNDSNEFMLESLPVNSINDMGRFGFEELASALRISTDEAEGIVSALRIEGKIKGTITLNGKSFITRDRIKEEILRSIE